MKKTIQILLIIILVLVLSLIIVSLFNPFNLRTKLIGSIINSYLSNTIENYSPAGDSANNTGTTPENNTAEVDKNPLLSAEQEKTLESYGVDVSQLPSTITPNMEACFVEALGQERANAIVAGASPTALEIFKAKGCLGE